MSGPAPLVLREAELRALVSPADAIAAITDAWRDYGTRRQVLSTPSSMFLSGTGAAFKVKGAVLPGQGVAGFRLIGDTHVPGGGELTQDWIWVVDAATARPLGLVDELWLHRLRTAVTGVVAAQHLARPDCRSLALVGAGPIADEILAPLMQVMPMRRVRVAARSLASAERFAARHRATAPVEPAADVEQALEGADLVMTITNAAVPFLAARHMPPGRTVIAMGGDAELAPDILDATDRFVIDDLDFAAVVGSVSKWIKAGAFTRETVAARLAADIGEVVAGAKPGRTGPAQRILAIIQGMASGDLALAALALRRARERGLGAALPL